jgi:formiminoglutamase
MVGPDMSAWTGRVDTADGPTALRWHQMVKPLAPDAPPGLVLIGFACDEGVRRNGGRVGAKEGPRALRAALANLAWHREYPVFDAGDVECTDGDLEGAQSRLAELVARAHELKKAPLVLGGGHETAWGTFQGIAAAHPGARIGVINIDAHLDLRADGRANSGTPFYQIAQWCRAHDRPFYYLALGVAAPSNTRALFDRAGELGAVVRLDTELAQGDLDRHAEQIRRLAGLVDVIHLSIDLDVLPASVMPAVSAPAGRGVPLETVEALVAAVLKTGQLAAVDIVELNPSFDIDGHGARVAARLAWQIAL